MIMKRISAIIAILVMLVAAQVLATDDPHAGGNSITCEQCHITHGTLGDILVDSTDGLVSTLCLSCHSPGGWVGMNKELSSAEIADPGVSGSSHAWDVDADNALLGAQPPLIGALLAQLDAGGGLEEPHLLDHVQDEEGQFIHRVRALFCQAARVDEGEIGV